MTYSLLFRAAAGARPAGGAKQSFFNGLARAHGIPFYVAAPHSTFDLTLATAAAISIEQWNSREITYGLGKQAAPDGIAVYNPAFDVTPANLIAALITECGIIHAVTVDNVRRVVGV